MHLWISIRLTGAEIKWMGGGKGGYLHRFQSNHSNPFISSIKLHLFIFPSLFSPLSLSLSPSPFRFQTLLNASINLFRISFFLSGFFISWAIPSVINTHGGPVSASPASPSVAQRSHQLFKVQTTASNPLNPKIILPPPPFPHSIDWLVSKLLLDCKAIIKYEFKPVNPLISRLFISSPFPHEPKIDLVGFFGVWRTLFCNSRSMTLLLFLSHVTTNFHWIVVAVVVSFFFPPSKITILSVQFHLAVAKRINDDGNNNNSTFPTPASHLPAVSGGKWRHLWGPRRFSGPNNNEQFSSPFWFNRRGEKKPSETIAPFSFPSEQQQQQQQRSRGSHEWINDDSHSYIHGFELSLNQ